MLEGPHFSFFRIGNFSKVIESLFSPFPYMKLSMTHYETDHEFAFTIHDRRVAKCIEKLFLDGEFDDCVIGINQRLEIVYAGTDFPPDKVDEKHDLPLLGQKSAI